MSHGKPRRAGHQATTQVPGMAGHTRSPALSRGPQGWPRPSLVREMSSPEPTVKEICSSDPVDQVRVLLFPWTQLRSLQFTASLRPSSQICPLPFYPLSPLSSHTDLTHYASKHQVLCPPTGLQMAFPTAEKTVSELLPFTVSISRHLSDPPLKKRPPHPHPHCQPGPDTLQPLLTGSSSFACLPCDACYT
jgi:hypothetical protein